MSTVYPGALDAFTNPTPASDTNTVSHAGQHQNHNDSITALETKVGITGSAVNTTLDYKTANITGGDRAIGATQTVPITNKTLSTATKILIGSDATGDTYYNGGSGTLTRLAIGSTGQVLTVTGGVPVWTSPSASNTNYVVDTGAANAYVVTLVPALGAYTAGVLVQFKATNANTTASTVNVNGLGVKTIKKLGGATDLVSGDIAAGMVVSLEYDGTNFVMLNPVANPPTGKSYDGVIDTGNATAYVITPSPAITSYATYQEFTFKAVNANTTTTPTINISGLGTKTIINNDGSAIGLNQITANSINRIVYDGTNFRLLSNTPNLINSTSWWQVATSANTQHTNSATVNFPSFTTPVAATKFKESVYNDISGTITIGWSINITSGSGTSTPRSQVYINGSVQGSSFDGSGTYSQNLSVNPGDLVQIYAYILSYVSGNLIFNVNTLTFKYDKTLKAATYIASTSNS